MKHTKKYPRRINRAPSAAQRIRRTAYRQCVNFWSSSVPLADRQLWFIYASRHPYKTRKGKTVFLSAYNAFLHINIYRAYSNTPLTSSPPTD